MAHNKYCASKCVKMIVSTKFGEKLNRKRSREQAKFYYELLIRVGWGIIRIAEEHGLEPIYPYGNDRIMPDGKEPQGVWTEEHLINELAEYFYNGGDYLV